MNSPLQPTLTVRGFDVFKGFLGPEAQRKLVAQLRAVGRAAPMFAPRTASGRAMSVRMTSAGQYGWLSDRAGYRYERQHPSGTDWPPIPSAARAVWDALAGVTRAPQSCLVNYYGEGARMGLHQDRDEADFRWPVVSVSLGDDALFRVGGTTRGGRTDSIWLSSGDVVVIGGTARLAFHGVDRIRFGSSALLPRGGRLNVTLRVVD